MRYILIFMILLFSISSFGENEAKDTLLGKKEAKESNELVSNVQTLVTDLKTKKIGKIADICVSLTTLIICIGAVCTIATKTIAAALKGEVIKLETLMMPFIFAMVISAYQPATQGVDWVIEGFDGLIASLSEDSLEEINEKRALKTELVQEIEKKRAEMRDVSFLDKAVVAVTDALRDFKIWITYHSVQILAYSASFLTKLIGSVLGLIFYVIGPVAIALSVIPAFADNWKNWLAKYVWVQLFTPVCRVISWVLQEVELTILNTDISRLQYCLDNIETTKGGMDVSGGGFMQGTAYLAFMVVGAILFICVPSIASWIVNTSGGGVMTGMNALGVDTLSKGSQVGKNTIQQGRGATQWGGKKGFEAAKWAMKKMRGNRE